MMVILWGLQSPTVETKRVECLLHVQPLCSQLPVHSDINTFLPRAVNLLHPAPSASDWSHAALWMSEAIHAITCTSLQIPFVFFLQAIVIPKCFFFNHVAPHTISLQHSALQTLHITNFILRNTVSPKVPQYFTISFYSFIINRMVHWTNTKLDSYYTSLYSCHHTERNTAQMHIANILNAVLRRVICIVSCPF